MGNPFDALSQLLLERKATADEASAIAARQAKIEARIREVAALLAASPGSPVVAEASAPAEFTDIQRRQRELLWHLKEKPGAHSNDYAKSMYGRLDLASKRSVTAYFSRLKQRGYVTTSGPGLFSITPKGVAAALDPDLARDGGSED